MSKMDVALRCYLSVWMGLNGMDLCGVRARWTMEMETECAEMPEIPPSAETTDDLEEFF